MGLTSDQNEEQEQERYRLQPPASGIHFRLTLPPLTGGTVDQVSRAANRPTPAAVASRGGALPAAEQPDSR